MSGAVASAHFLTDERRSHLRSWTISTLILRSHKSSALFLPFSKSATMFSFLQDTAAESKGLQERIHFLSIYGEEYTFFLGHFIIIFLNVIFSAHLVRLSCYSVSGVHVALMRLRRPLYYSKKSITDSEPINFRNSLLLQLHIKFLKFCKTGM